MPYGYIIQRFPCHSVNYPLIFLLSIYALRSKLCKIVQGTQEWMRCGSCYQRPCPSQAFCSLPEGILKSLLPAAKVHLYYFLRQFEILTVISASMNIKPLAAFIHLPPARCVSLPDLQAIVPSPHSHCFNDNSLLMRLQTTGSTHRPARP